MKQYLASVRTAAWTTAGARYNAARRLRQREAFSTFSMASLSALTVAVAFAQRVYSPTAGTRLDNYLTALSVALGVFLLVISLLEWGAGYGAKAHALHMNAEALTSYQRKLEMVLAQIDAGRVLTESETDALRLEYEDIKVRCEHNHSPIDYDLFKAQRRESPEFSAHVDWLNSLVIRARWYASIVWFLGLVWLSVATSIVFVLWI